MTRSGLMNDNPCSYQQKSTEFPANRFETNDRKHTSGTVQIWERFIDGLGDH
jgi:hypothetical protein